MIERLVENWLDNASERSYQKCFCQMLCGQGYRIIHNTRHTPQEWGKDIIAISPEGKTIGYQLKGDPGGTLTPNSFSKIRTQLEQLAVLVPTIPGFDKRLLDECYLVTNGEIHEDVNLQLNNLNQSLESRGHQPQRIKTLTRGTLLDWAKSLGLSLWPSEFEDFGNLVKILNFDGDESFPAKTFHSLLYNTLKLNSELRKNELRRRITSAAVMTSVALHSFSKKNNFYAEITAWIMFISYSIAACEKNRLSYSRNVESSIIIAGDTIYDLLSELCEEAKDRNVLAEGDIFSEFAFHHPRALIVYMTMGLYWIWSEREGWKIPEHKEIIESMIPDKLDMRWLWGEGAIPQIITVLWYRMKVDSTMRQELMLEILLRTLLNLKIKKNYDLASPYFDVESIVKHNFANVLGCDDPYEGYEFKDESFFAESLMIFLTRANMKQACKNLWPDFTRIHHHNFIPDHPWQFCLYRAGEGGLNSTEIYPLTYHWNDLKELAREHSGSSIPKPFKNNPILLLLFINIFPFRANFDALRFLHKEFDGTWLL